MGIEGTIDFDMKAAFLAHLMNLMIQRDSYKLCGNCSKWFLLQKIIYHHCYSRFYIRGIDLTQIDQKIKFLSNTFILAEKNPDQLKFLIVKLEELDITLINAIEEAGLLWGVKKNPNEAIKSM